MKLLLNNVSVNAAHVQCGAVSVIFVIFGMLSQITFYIGEASKIRKKLV
jgi:hypothetical protein